MEKVLPKSGSEPVYNAESLILGYRDENNNYNYNKKNEIIDSLTALVAVSSNKISH